MMFTVPSNKKINPSLSLSGFLLTRASRKRTERNMARTFAHSQGRMGSNRLGFSKAKMNSRNQTTNITNVGKKSKQQEQPVATPFHQQNSTIVVSQPSPSFPLLPRAFYPPGSPTALVFNDVLAIVTVQLVLLLFLYLFQKQVCRFLRRLFGRKQQDRGRTFDSDDDIDL